MKSWTYECSCGKRTKHLFDAGQHVPAKKRCACGKHAERTFAGCLGTPSRSGWPMASWSAGVFPDQINEARESDTKLGVSCDFTKDGDRIFRDRGHRRDWLRAYGQHDRNGGYGD